MDALLTILKGIGQFPIRHKWKILALPFIALAWAVVIFPYGDLRGLASSQVSKLMPGTALDFQNVSLGIGTPLAIVLEEVEFERPGTPALKADRVSASPALSTLFGGAPGGSVSASGLFEGSLQASLKTASKEGKDGAPATFRHDIKGSATDIQVGALTSSLKRAGLLGLTAKGQLSSDFDLSVDPSFQSNPAGSLSLSGTSIEIPAISIPLPGMGPVQLPSLQFGKLDFKGRLQEGNLAIEELVLGQSTDALSGRMRGKLELALRGGGGRMNANISDVDLNIELSVSDKLMGSFLGQAIDLLISKYKQKAAATASITKYRFRLRLPQLGMTPNFSEAAAFD